MPKLYLFILLIFSFQLYGQGNSDYSKSSENPDLKGSLTGKVTDGKTSSVLAGASVYINDLKIGTFTDANGDYSFRNIPDGNHLVEVSFIGFSTRAEYVAINGDTKKDFILGETVVENNTVVITGSTSAVLSKNTPTPVSQIRKEELFRSTAPNIMEALAKKPGVSTLTTGPSISKPIIRGLGSNRVVVISDGVRQEGQQWGDEHGIEIDEFSVGKVEILKGPGSVMYGSDALAGVVNFISNTPISNNSSKFNFFTNYQTNNRLSALHGDWSGNANGVNWNIYGSNKSASDYQNKYDGYVFNSKFNEKSFGGYAGYNGGWGYSHLLFSSFQLNTGLTEGQRDADGNFTKELSSGIITSVKEEDFKNRNPDAFFPHQHVRHIKIATDNNFKLGKGKISLNIGLQRNRREEFANVDDPEERALYFDLKTLTGNLQYHLPEMKGWKTSLGLSGMKQDNTNKGVEQLIPDYTIKDAGGFIYIRKTIQKLSLSGGARYDSRDLSTSNLLNGSLVKTPAFHKTFSNFSGSIGAAYAVSEQLNLKFNIARGYRAPGVAELASNGNHEGTLRYEYGSRDLKSETSFQVDAGFEFITEHLSFTASTFYNAFSNFIFYNKLEAVAGGDSMININGTNLTAFRFNQRKAIMSGLEMTLDFHPHPLDRLHLENTISFTTGRFAEAIDLTKNMPLIPAPRWITELRLDLIPQEGFKNGYIKLELDNTFAQEQPFTAYHTETSTPGYSILNLGMGADFVTKKNKPVCSLYLSGNNLGDVAYQNHLSRLKYADVNEQTGRRGVFNMGRNFSIKLNIPLGFSFK